ncbi:MAG: spore germination protein GerW family protein, partial [Chloroflexota bacterium]|nr:spore germination protein GerW family protein [Chloroflexota bacterium]
APMQIDEILGQARDTMTVRRVFGEPIERDGLTLVPVANVMGGAGGGGGEAPAPGAEGAAGSDASGPPMGSGMGVGYGVRATPAGVYVIKDGDVRWEPAMDLTRIAIMGQIVAIVLLLVVRSVLRSRA